MHKVSPWGLVVNLALEVERLVDINAHRGAGPRERWHLDQAKNRFEIAARDAVRATLEKEKP